MKNPIRLVLVILIFLVWNNPMVRGQNNNFIRLGKCVRLEGGFIGGAQLSDKSEAYIPGASFQYSYCLKAGTRAGIGLGGGIHYLDKIGFIPFYLDVIAGIKKQGRSPFFSFQAGYAFGWNSEFDDDQGYSLNGPCFGLGLGYKFRERGHFAPYISVAYRHQIFPDQNNNSYIESAIDGFNYSMFLINIGIILEQ
jgi:hypothetical protein